MSALARTKRQLLRQIERRRCIDDLHYLCVKYLDYRLMDNEFNQEVCSFLNSNRTKREVGVFTPRSTYKSTTMAALCIQAILQDPGVEIFYIHHREVDSQAVIAEVGKQLLYNEKLRAILPDIHRPNPASKQWLKAGFFTIPGRRHIPGRKFQHPTLTACSSKMNLTGSHPTFIVLDDLVNSDAVAEAGNAEVIRMWTESTLANIGTDARWRLAGTVWSDDDYHSDIMKADSGWAIYRRSLSEDPITREPKYPEQGGVLLPVTIDKTNPRPLDMEEFERRRRTSRRFFPSQHMMIPDRAGRRVWNPDTCEHFVDFSDIEKYLKRVVVLSDPAPVGVNEVQGKDSKKDDWAVAVIGFLSHQRRIVKVLLDGGYSDSWTTPAGIRRVRHFMEKWGTKFVAIEEPRGAGQKAKHFATDIKEQCRKVGMGCHPVDLRNGRVPKEYRIADLAAAAEIEDFIICDTHCDEAFLERFLSQARNWAGKDSLPHDDCLDAVAFCEDTALSEIKPTPTVWKPNQSSPFTTDRSRRVNRSSPYKHMRV